MDKKVLLGIGGVAALVAAWALMDMFSGGSEEFDPNFEDDAALEEGMLGPPPEGEQEETRRLTIRDHQDLDTREVAVYVDTGEEIIRLASDRGWVRLPVSPDRLTPAAALADNHWSSVSEIPAKSEEPPVLKATVASSHLRVSVEIEGLDHAAEPWVEIHPLGDDGLSAAAILYLNVLTAGSFRFFGTNGEVKVQDLPPAVYQLDIGHSGCPSVRIQIKLEAGQVGNPEVRLQQGSSLRGTVQTVDKEGENIGLKRATVALWPIVSGNIGWDDPLTTFRIYGIFPARIPQAELTQTGVGGLAQLGDIPPEKYRVLAFAEGYRPLVGEQILELGAGEEIEFDALTLSKGKALQLNLLAEEGSPVPNAEIHWQLRPPSGRPLLGQLKSLKYTTGADGRCLIDGLPEAELWLQILHPNYAVYETQIDLTSEQNTLVKDVTLLHGRDLTGQVLDQTSGEPIAGVSLKILPQVGSAGASNAFGSSYPTEVISDDQGMFGFHSLPPATYLLLVHHEQYAASLSNPIAVDAEHERPQTLMLARGASLDVELLDASGMPAAQELVVVRSEEPESFSRERTNDQGIARFQHLAAGTYRVMHADSVADAMSSGGRLHRDYEFTSLLDSDERKIILGGRIVHSTLEGFLLLRGRPVQGYRVALLADDGTRMATTDASGFYQFEGLIPGRYLFQVTSPTGPSTGSFYGSAWVSSEDVVKRDILLPSSSIKVRVVDASTGRPIAYMPITLRPADGTDLLGGQFQATDEQGMVEFGTLRDGDYLVCAGDGAAPFYGGDGKYGAILEPITVLAAKPQSETLELRAPRGATLTVRVEDRQGRPLEGVFLHFQDAYGNVLNQASLQGTNTHGDTSIRGLPSGPGYLVARHPKLGVTRLAIDLVPGQRTKRVVRLQPGVTVHVQVVDSEGSLVPGVMAQLLNLENQSVGDLRSTAELQAARLAYLRGTAQTLGPLLPGTYTLRLHRPGEVPLEETIVVQGSQDMHLRLTY
ncbi:MAG: carboxypeptidase regulatory-like domain-containing protein [Planctomycetota bacterium]|nr:carboxypeptidase regulatory-like domain-containing protein [Planctomycetota bacterium]